MALKEAYDSGASSWSSSRKSQFANDPLNQWCLAASINVSKSDGDLAEWRRGSCAQRKYIARITLQVKRKYALSIDAAERRAINSALAATCAAAVTAPSTAAASSGVGRTQPSAGTADRLTGQIAARRLAGGGTEFGFQPTGGTLALPQARFFPADARVGRWLSSSLVVVGGVEIGRISARLLSDGRIEFAFAPTNAERILPRGRYFPPNAVAGRWLRSSAIDVGGG